MDKGQEQIMCDNTDIMESVKEIAEEAGQIALSQFGASRPHVKTDRSFVTATDREVEQFIHRKLHELFPDDAIIGEEFGRSRGTIREYVWLLDPIDGTTNFVAGLPHWAVCVARLRFGVPVLGVVVLPVLRETYAAATGMGATLNGSPFKMLERDDPPNEQLIAVWSTWYREVDLKFSGKVRTLGSTVVKCLYAAKGSFVGALTPEVHAWDIAAGLPVLWESGGQAYARDGKVYEVMDLDPANGYLVPPLILSAPSRRDFMRQMITARRT